MQIPKDPIMLLSFINLKLRDYYSGLDALCEDLELDPGEIKEKLKGAGYSYDSDRNQFV